MTLSTLTYDPVSGSDTAASGAGPATAITGSAATNGSGNVVNLDGSPDLSGVSVNDVLWVNLASTVRTLTRITAVDDGADTVTTEDTLVLSSESWAIGGKRKTLQADVEYSDISQGKAGWTFSLEDGADYVFATRASASDPIVEITEASTVADGPIKVVTANGANPVILTWSSGGHFLDMAVSSDVEFDGASSYAGMTIRNTTSVSVGARFMETASSAFLGFKASHLTILCHGLVWQGADAHLMFHQCDLRSVGADGLDLGGTRVQAILDDVILHNCGASGLISGGGQTGGLSMRGCVVRDNGASGIKIEGGQKHWLFHISNNVFHDNTNDGIGIKSTINQDLGPGLLVNNVFTGNGGYGITAGSDISGGMNCLLVHYNAFRNNTSGRTNNITSTNEVILTADPYTDESTDDYTTNATAGGGAAMRDAGQGLG